MIRVIALMALLIVSGHQEVAELAKKHDARVIVRMHMTLGWRGMAILPEGRSWASNGKRTTRIMQAPTRDAVYEMLADEMRPGVKQD
jgi:hypothetical protein